MLVINPGTGDVDGTTEENAIRNMIHFLREVNLEGAEFYRFTTSDENDRGRYGFNVGFGERFIGVDMVGLPLEQVQYRNGMNAWDFPRLYVQGSSWLWEYAVDMARHLLTREDEED